MASASGPVPPSPPRRTQAAPRAAMVLVWISVAASLAGFLLPWVTLDLRGVKLVALAGAAPAGPNGARKALRDVGRVTIQLRRGGETIAATLPAASEPPLRVSGIEIPWLIRREQAQAAVALLELLTDTHQHAALKSCAVFLVPGAALLCGVLLTGWGHRPAVAAGIALACAVVAAGGAWRLLTLEPSRSPIGVTIEWGVWLSLAAYVGLAASAALRSRGGRKWT